MSAVIRYFIVSDDNEFQNFETVIQLVALIRRLSNKVHMASLTAGDIAKSSAQSINFSESGLFDISAEFFRKILVDWQRCK